MNRFPAHVEQTIAALSAYWDALVLGDDLTKVQEHLDETYVSTIDRISTRHNDSTVDPGFASALRAQLLAVATGDSQRPPGDLPRLPVAHRSVVRERAATGRQKSVRPALFIAISILMLTVTVAGVAIWSVARPDDSQSVPMISVADQGGVFTTILLEEQVGAGLIQGSPSKWVSLFKFGLAPGQYWRDTPSPCPLSRQYVVGIVESGTLAMINTGSFEIQRKDGTVDQIPAGERADVHPGDSWVYFSDRSETNVNKWNPGPVPMIAYQTDWALDKSCESVPINPEWIWHDSTNGITFDDQRPMVVRLEQVLIADPGGTLSDEEAERLGLIDDEDDVLTVAAVESGSLQVTVRSAEPGSEESATEESISVEAGGTWMPQRSSNIEDGELREFSSSGSGPLILTVFSWSYDE